MAFEVGDRKRLAFLVAIVVMLGVAGYVWYPRLFSKKPSLRVQQQAPPPLLIEVPQEKEKPVEVAPTRPRAPAAPRTAAKPPPTQAPKEPKQTARAAPGAPAEPRAGGGKRYGLEFPPFVTMAEAEEHERRLKAAGLPTLRTVTAVDGSLYTLVVGPLPTAARAGEVIAELRAKGPASPAAGEGGFVFNDGPYVLREVVQRALEIRAKGYGVQIVRAEGKAPLYVIRTAASLDTAQASRLSSHYRQLGFPNSVVSR